MEKIAWKFVKCDVDPLETLKGTCAYKLKEKVLQGIKLTREEKDYITSECVRSSYFTRSSIICRLGWAFDFSTVMKRYVVKQHGDWVEYCACDKTALRKCLYGSIDKIVEI